MNMVGYLSLLKVTMVVHFLPFYAEEEQLCDSLPNCFYFGTSELEVGDVGISIFTHLFHFLEVKFGGRFIRRPSQRAQSCRNFFVNCLYTIRKKASFHRIKGGNNRVIITHNHQHILATNTQLFTLRLNLHRYVRNGKVSPLPQVHLRQHAQHIWIKVD